MINPAQEVTSGQTLFNNNLSIASSKAYHSTVDWSKPTLKPDKQIEHPTIKRLKEVQGRKITMEKIIFSKKEPIVVQGKFKVVTREENDKVAANGKKSKGVSRGEEKKCTYLIYLI